MKSLHHPTPEEALANHLSRSYPFFPELSIQSRQSVLQNNLKTVISTGAKRSGDTRFSCRRAAKAKRLAFAIALLVGSIMTQPAHAQGCTQCLDNTAATPPKTQAAYRHAIIFMTISAGSLFLGTLIIFKRYR
jgi:hypothetical protein